VNQATEGDRRVAIACQGGGSHTAFTAGVLSRMLRDGEPDGYRVVGFSGTSGGAVCATLSWRAFVAGKPADAARRLHGYWEGTAADTPVELAANAGLVWTSVLQNVGLLPLVSPYDVPIPAQETFRELLAPWADLDGVGADPDREHPLLVVGAVDVVSGRFRAFDSWTEPITVDEVLASAAIPTVFPAVHLPDGVYWDGLFSQNPPVRELLDSKPDELWVIQINATAIDEEPRTVLDIADRRNELAGNLSLFQELKTVEKIDRLLAEGVIPPDGPYKPVVVRVLELSRSRSSRLLGPSSKLNRDRRFLEELMAQGEQQADEFLAALRFESAWWARDDGALIQLLADDLELVSHPPFPPRGPLRGAEARAFIRDYLAAKVRMDLTRAQHTSDRAAWTVTAEYGGRTGPALVEAELRDGQVARIRLGAPPDKPDEPGDC
jgi:NTE family protein